MPDGSRPAGDHGMETLYAPFGVDKAARGLGERSNWQQNVTELHVGLERAQRDHHFCTSQGSCSLSTRRRIMDGLSVQQHRRLQTTGEHLSRIQTTVDRVSARKLRATVLAASVGNPPSRRCSQQSSWPMPTMGLAHGAPPLPNKALRSPPSSERAMASLVVALAPCGAATPFSWAMAEAMPEHLHPLAGTCSTNVCWHGPSHGRPKRWH